MVDCEKLVAIKNTGVFYFVLVVCGVPKRISDKKDYRNIWHLEIYKVYTEKERDMLDVSMIDLLYCIKSWPMMFVSCYPWETVWNLIYCRNLDFWIALF